MFLSRSFLLISCARLVPLSILGDGGGKNKQVPIRLLSIDQANCFQSIGWAGQNAGNVTIVHIMMTCHTTDLIRFFCGLCNACDRIPSRRSGCWNSGH